MRIVSVSRLRPGMRLGQSIYSNGGPKHLPLLVAGTALDDQKARALERAGFGAVYVEDDLAEGIAPTFLPPALRDRAVAEVGEIFARAASDGVTKIGYHQVQRLEGVVTQVLAAIKSADGVASSLADLGGFDRYTLEHSVNVMTLGLSLSEYSARNRGWREWDGTLRRDVSDSRLTKLGVGLLLHDIGKMVIPTSILRKPGRLTGEEMAIVKEHPRAGIEMVERGALSPLSKVVIAGHHERWDGSGYPAAKAGDEIHEHAQVAGIVDAYDAISSTRSYRSRRPPHVAWQMISEMADASFSKRLVADFRRAITPYGEGLSILLSDGRRAVVVRNNRDHNDRPVVRVATDEAGAPVTAYELDLADEPETQIIDRIGDVSERGPSRTRAERTPALARA